MPERIEKDGEIGSDGAPGTNKIRGRRKSMALIKCPGCGKEISDKAAACPNCGTVFKVEPKKTCSECGAELEEGMRVCPNCGCPVQEEHVDPSAPQKVEVTGVKIATKSKKKIGAIIGLIIAIIVVGAGIFQVKKSRDIKEYYSNLEDATITMLRGASTAEDVCNLTKKVWYNAIYEEKDSETDKYTKKSEYSFYDFNTALSNLFADSSFSKKISSLKTNQSEVNEKMKALKNPPDEYKEAYEKLSKFYDAYISFTNLAIDPSGSLQTYSNNVNDADSNTLNCYNAMKIYITD